MFLESSDHVDYSKHTCYVLLMRRKDLATHKVRGDDGQSSIFTAFQAISPSKSSLEGMNHEKMLSAHVWRRRMRLKHRKLTPIVSTRRYDHKEACKHSYGVLMAHKKFFRDPQGQHSCSTTSSFWAPKAKFWWKINFWCKKRPWEHVWAYKISLGQ